MKMINNIKKNKKKNKKKTLETTYWTSKSYYMIQPFLYIMAVLLVQFDSQESSDGKDL